MLKNCDAFSSFSTNDINKTKEFYENILGMKIKDNSMGFLELDPEHCSVLIYPKENHEPAEFTVLNFYVPDLEKQVDLLTAKGVKFEIYDGEVRTNEKGIHRGGDTPGIAWFRDPAGNILSLIEQNN
ncbi:VOC family protein [Christiangramia sabulilitoris]|uniref:VOC family protein n=1 Tax=Christiangramia sabulilitoris TaxID=2583991 RepID=A0A550I6A3_9FLAO|nr:VOC family protein [Christiangramia sabulilitoris]TRO66503.1 VOC family protein [Christiangramia sabulilitoris]